MLAKRLGVVLTFMRHHRIRIVVSVSINFGNFLGAGARGELAKNWCLLVRMMLMMMMMKVERCFCLAAIQLLVEDEIACVSC